MEESVIWEEDIESISDGEAPDVEKVEAVAQDRIVVTFTHYIVSGISKDAFKIVEIDDEENEKIIAECTKITTSRNDKGNTVVTVTLDKGVIPVDVEFEESLDVKLVIEAILKNDLDVEASNINISAAKFEDKITPEIKEKEEEEDVLDVTATAGEYTIKIEFTEDINDNALSSKTFKVDGYTVKSVTAIDSTVTITLTDNDNIKAGKVKITQAQPVEDMAGNEYTHKGTITVTVTESEQGGGEG